MTQIEMALRRARHTRLQTLGLFAALGIIGGAFAVPVMAQQVLNQAPTAQPDTASTTEDTAVTIAVLANDTDPDGNALTIVGFVSPSHGTVVVNAGTSVTYTPATNYAGPDTFAYTVSDGQGGATTGTVTITVTAVNDPPVAVADAVASTAGAITIAVLANDTDVDGDTLSVTTVTQGAHGTVGVSAVGVAVYNPASGFSGVDTFTYTVSDGHGGTATASVTVTVTAVAVNHAPVAVDDSVSVKQDTSKTIAILANDSDPDGDSLSLGATTPPAHGSIIVNADQTITYTPVAGYAGSDVFTYTISDGHGANATATVTLAVTVGPVASGDKDDCKHGGWLLLGFRNQGLCVAASNHANHDDDDDDGDHRGRGHDGDDDDGDGDHRGRGHDGDDDDDDGDHRGRGRGGDDDDGRGDDDDDDDDDD